MEANRSKSIEESVEQSLEQAATELEKVGEEIRVKLHLAGMDAKSLWNDKLEPELFQARQHAREATQASKSALRDTLKALKAFSASI